MRARTTEVAAAIGAAIFGTGSIAFVLFAPTVSTMSGSSDIVGPDGSIVQSGSTITLESHSLIEDGLERAVIVALLIPTLLFAWLSAVAILHGRPGSFRTSAPIWVPAILLCVFVFLTGFSIGLIFAPSALLALVAGFAATRYAGNLQRMATGAS